MKTSGLIYRCVTASMCLLTLLVVPQASRAQRCDPGVAKAVSVQGLVEFQAESESGWQQVKLNDTFCPGDQIRVQDQSRADLALVNQPVLRLDENTTITLGGVQKERSLVEMFRGAAHFFSRAPRSLKVVTAFVNAGVEGTEFYIRVDEDNTFLSIFEGKVLAANDQGSLALTSGQAAVAEAGKAPVRRTVVRPRDAVQWALYYPPVVHGKPPAEDESDPRYLAYRASLRLSVGRVDEAQSDLDKALELRPGYGEALAMEAVIAVVQSDKEKALFLAQEAVASDPDAAASHLALSYAQQARFDLDGALASLQEAVKVEPDNALAWSRLAEIWSAQGYLDRSLKAAQKAVDLDPGLSRTQTVLGFAYLTRVETTEAKAAFEKAIRFDQADPLPRLGLGLAKIREGDLDEGGREIEVAASLAPNDALVRSYLGKVYFEQKKGELDTREFQIAKELDPNDPTPWFYDAIAKQTTNRPVEALQDLQKAKELNDNRAVYRSKLQLDSDLAARSASIARVYNDLGFQQRGLYEGWMSVNTDPTNYSAHRFLADTYSAMPRHEIARVSELLQSQLLQPINITPIQPQQAESNLFLISSQGPSSLSFREFNPLFNRNQVNAQANFMAGGNSTLSGEGIVSGIQHKLSFSAGVSYFKTDGWYENADQQDTIADAFAQYEWTPETSIQAEYRGRNSDRGDVTLHFFEDNTLSFFREREKTHIGRVGFRHSFSPASVLIGNFQLANGDTQQKDRFLYPASDFLLPPPPVEDYTDDSVNDKAYSGEFSYLYRSRYIDMVGGLGAFSVERDTTYTDSLYWPGLTPPLFFGTFSSPLRTDTKHYNLYLYSHVKPVDELTLTVGGSGDFYDADDKDIDAQDFEQNQFNPKLGIVWRALPGTTFRGAAFRTLKRTLITDQTLEPTQVAGINQFFDDVNATDAWVYGGAVDQKFAAEIYGGAELAYRDLKVPYTTGFGATTAYQESDWDEYLGRAYLYWTPHPMIALSAEYGYEKFEYSDEVNLGAKEVKTHRFPLGVNFFHPNGLSAGLKATYTDQKGIFERFSTAQFESASDTFWIVDAAVRYRLPHRAGFLSFGVTNVLDEDSFRYWEVDLKNPRFQPGRTIFGSVTIALP